MRRGGVRGSALAVLISLQLGGCLIAPSPRFEDDASADVGTGDGDCPLGTLDCNGEPGCESDAEDPGTCGSCDKSCEFKGELLHCAEGLCFGTVELVEFDDAEIDASRPDEQLGLDDRLNVRGGPSPQDTYIELPGVDELPPGAELHDASLYLSCSVSEADTSIHRVEGEWAEDTITWSTAPGADAEPLAIFSPVVGDNVIDLLELLPAWAGAPNYGLALRSVFGVDEPVDNGHVELAAGESDMGPRLSLTLSW